MADLGKIKGVAFGEFLAWAALRQGVASVETAVQRVEARHRQGLDVTRNGYGVLASRWYPAASVHDLVNHLTEGRTAAELDEMALDAAAFIMGRTMKGVYRAVFSMFATPERYARHINKLWGMHYDSGVITVEQVGPGHQRVRYDGWLGHHPFICRMNMSSSLALYGAMGCKDVVFERLRCQAAGHTCCENVVRWKA